MTMTAHIRNEATGEVREHQLVGIIGEGAALWSWTEGDSGCDCNRALFWERAKGGEDPNLPCSDGLFRVRLEREDGSLLLDEWNI